jgi:hypothetical protein
MSITVFIYIDHPNGVPSEQTTNTFSQARGEPKSFNVRCISHGTIGTILIFIATKIVQGERKSKFICIFPSRSQSSRVSVK